MKKLILNFALIILTIGIISSCQKEKMNVDANAPTMAQTDLKGMEGLKSNALQYKAIAEKNQERTEAELTILKQKIEKLKAERSQLEHQEVASSIAGNSPIRVPQDYPSLQEAVNHSQSGGKIFIQGTVAEPGDVLVNVSGLTIQGQGSSPTINGSTLIIASEGIKVQNLTVNMATVISGTTDVKLMNSTFTATNNIGAIGVLLLINSSNNTIKNCIINGAYTDGSHQYGVYLDDLSNQNLVENCTAKNTFGIPNLSNSSAFRTDGADNIMKNCTAISFTRGFSSFYSVNNKNNKFEACVANSSVNDAGFVCFLADENHITFENCVANNNFGFGFFISGGICNMSKCTANTNTADPESIFGLGVFVLAGDFHVKESTFKYNSSAGIVIVELDPNTGNFFDYTGTLEKDTTLSNGKFGIYLLGLKNSYVIDNTSTGHPICDFNQTFCSGNSVSGNNFGTNCANL